MHLLCVRAREEFARGFHTLTEPLTGKALLYMDADVKHRFRELHSQVRGGGWCGLGTRSRSAHPCLEVRDCQESKDIHHHRVGTELLFFIRGDIWCKFALDRHAVALWILSNTDIYILPVERYRNICLLTYLQAPTVRLLVVLMRARCTSWRFIICSNVNLRTSDPSSPSAFLVRLLR